MSSADLQQSKAGQRARLPDSSAVSQFNSTPVVPISLPQVPRAEDGEEPRAASDGQLGRALKPVIEQVILDTLKENPRVVIDIVYPVLGRVIRKSIASALQGLVVTIENQAANVFSPERFEVAMAGDDQ